MHTTSDQDRGLYQKYKVTRTDGSSRKGKKHHQCRYFVLDLTHDPYAAKAIKAYARACRKKLPELAADLMNEARQIEDGPSPFFGL